MKTKSSVVNTDIDKIESLKTFTPESHHCFKQWPGADQQHNIVRAISNKPLLGPAMSRLSVSK